MHRRNSVIIAPLLVSLGASAQAAVTISSAPTQNLSCSDGVCAPTAATANLNTGDLENLLASSNVEVTTTGSGGVQATDIVVADGFSWATTSLLTLDAYHAIAVGAPVAVAGTGGLSFTTNDGGSGGTLSFGWSGNATFANERSVLKINGWRYKLVTTLPKLAHAVAANPSGSYALSQSYDAHKDGTYSAAPIAKTFNGKFEGLGNTISHLTIKGASKGAYLGLFAEVSKQGAIVSIRLTDTNIHAKQSSSVGAIAATNLGGISNAFASGEIDGSVGTKGGYFGGLVSGNQGTIADSAAGVNISIGAHGNKPGTFADAGGFAAANNGTILECYATGSVAITGTSTASPSAGFIGFNDGTIESSYAEGAAQANGTGQPAVGGFAGQNDTTIVQSYSTGAPSGNAGSSVGGLIGYDGSENALSDDYWDTSTSGVTNLSQGAGNIANDPGITGETTAQLQAGLPPGFDPTIWAENPSINNGLPYLIANPPP